MLTFPLKKVTSSVSLKVLMAKATSKSWHISMPQKLPWRELSVDQPILRPRPLQKAKIKVQIETEVPDVCSFSGPSHCVPLWPIPLKIVRHHYVTFKELLWESFEDHWGSFFVDQYKILSQFSNMVSISLIGHLWLSIKRELRVPWKPKQRLILLANRHNSFLNFSVSSSVRPRVCNRYGGC